MSEKFVVTIGRQFGSGGREIGQGIAERLGIPFYDKEILASAAKESGMMPHVFEQMDERHTSSLLYNLSMGNGYTMPFFYGIDNSCLPTGDTVFAWQAKTIEKFANESSCVIIGRCADYILQENPKLISIFIYADFEYRCERVAKENNLTVQAAAPLVRKTDKSRANYYNFSTGKRWGDMTNYDLSINSAKLGSEKTIKLLCEYIKTRNEI